jgi:isocitrate/isopropylmalate dehydrogenase
MVLLAVKNHRIAFYPGDGSGGEVIAEAVGVLEWLEHRKAVESALAQGAANRDMGGKLSTRQMTARILEELPC